MPCYKCSNGKYKYGERGRCQFDTLERCHEAEQAIHAGQNPKKESPSEYQSKPEKLSRSKPNGKK